jgi:RNA polymerase sigma factor (sigma-70 family)
MVTVRREALHILRARQREVPVAEVPEQIAADAPAPETGLRNWERRKKALRAAVELLPDRQRSLVSALTSQPGSTYDELSQRLGMPVGAIGPTRQRALARLRRNRELMMLSEADAS